MKILLADRQDITRAGLSYVIEKMEGLESKYVEDKAELMFALKENEDTVVILRLYELRYQRCSRVAHPEPTFSLYPMALV